MEANMEYDNDMDEGEGKNDKDDGECSPAEYDLRTLVSAAKIRKDPKRMAAVRMKASELRTEMAEAISK